MYMYYIADIHFVWSFKENYSSSKKSPAIICTAGRMRKNKSRKDKNMMISCDVSNHVKSYQGMYVYDSGRLSQPVVSIGRLGF
jgi:hypothetical protein